MRTVRRLADAYRFPGFRQRATVRGVFGDAKARVLRLQRRGKNGVRHLRPSALGVLRPQGPLDSGPAVWRHPRLPGGG
ncbi:MAG: hypothetical protein ACE1ZW_04400, partial [Nitrospirales bacterium]